MQIIVLNIGIALYRLATQKEASQENFGIKDACLLTLHQLSLTRMTFTNLMQSFNLLRFTSQTFSAESSQPTGWNSQL